MHWLLPDCWPQIAYCMILYLTGLKNVSPGPDRGSAFDGASGWKMLWYAPAGLCPATFFIAVVVTVIGALRSFDIVSIMTDGAFFRLARVFILLHV